jgi:hypothetical protein
VVLVADGLLMLLLVPLAFGATRRMVDALLSGENLKLHDALDGDAEGAVAGTGFFGKGSKRGLAAAAASMAEKALAALAAGADPSCNFGVRPRRSAGRKDRFYRPGTAVTRTCACAHAVLRRGRDHARRRWGRGSSWRLLGAALLAAHSCREPLG